MEQLTHINENGEAVMVDVSGKAVTVREAQAQGTILVGPAVLELLQRGDIAKGDVLAAARIAGIMACKKRPTSSRSVIRCLSRKLPWTSRSCLVSRRSAPSAP